MEAGEYDFTVEGGDCLTLRVILRDGDGNQFDLNGYSSTFVATWAGGSLTLDSGDRLEMAEAGGDSPIGNSPAGDSGLISGELSGFETSKLPSGRRTKYQWSLTEPSGCKRTFLKGYIIRK